MNISKTIMKKLERNNAHITEYLDAYRRMKDADFAVMITGPWGSGKTEFVKSWLGALSKIDNDDKLDYLSVSLNGISSLSDVDSLLFRSAHKFLGGRSVRFAGKVLGTIASGLRLTAGGPDTEIEFEFSSKDIKEMSFEKWIGDAPLLVFDDLERCSIDIESLMGYFGDLLNNKKKVVLVCAEEEMKIRCGANAINSNGRTMPSYVDICSKVVGKRFLVEAEIEDLYGVLVGQVKCGEVLGKFFIEQRDIFISVFNSVGEQADSGRRVHNYRAFKHALRDVAYWFDKMPVKERQNKEFLLAFTRAFILIDYALLSGVLLPKDAFVSGDDCDERTRFEKLMDSGGVSWNSWNRPEQDTGVPVTILKRMILNEAVGKDELAQAVVNSRYFASERRLNEWQQLLNWNRLEDNKMSQLLEDVLDNLDKFKYVMAEEILHVFSLLGEMANYGTYAKTQDEITEECTKYVEKVVSDDVFQLPTIDDADYCCLDDRGMGFQYSGSFDNKKYFTAAHEVVVAAVREVDERKQKSEIANMVQEFSKYPGRFYPMLRDPSCRWSREPVFDHVDVKVFYNAYCSLANEEKYSVGSILYGRACNRSLSSECKFWHELISLIDEDIKKCTDGAVPPSVFQKKMLSNQLKKVIDRDSETM